MLTLVGGRFRGRRLDQPPTTITRPTAQRTRAAIFNILSHNSFFPLVEARVIDVFAGSGAMGLEALSRGAAHVTFVEQDLQASQVLKQNVHKLGVERSCTLVSLPIQRLPQAAHPVDLVFIDPPYQANLETITLKLLQQRGWLHPTTFILMETAAANLWQAPPAFHLLDERRYGAARVSFLQLTKSEN
jgi:16S rRNA (guanine966-N2)-methyltransferase